MMMATISINDDNNITSKTTGPTLDKEVVKDPEAQQEEEGVDSDEGDDTTPSKQQPRRNNLRRTFVAVLVCTGLLVLSFVLGSALRGELAGESSGEEQQVEEKQLIQQASSDGGTATPLSSETLTVPAAIDNDPRALIAKMNDDSSVARTNSNTRTVPHDNIEDYNEDWVGYDPDEYGCNIAAGMTWCPELHECVGPNANCPFEGGKIEGPLTMQCLSGRCNSIPDECHIPRGSYSIGGPYLTDLDGEYFLPEGCSAICQGCEVAPLPSCEGCAWSMPCIPPDEDDLCNSGSSGHVFCPELESCIPPWMENCPVKGATFEGPLQIECSDGRCSDIPDECHIPRGTYFIGGPYISEMDGEYTLPEGCSAVCQGCEVVVSPSEPCDGCDVDEHGCIPSAGYEWCEYLGECIRPWETTCEHEPCVGCDVDEHGCIPSAGYEWCEYLGECIRPWETTCEHGPCVGCDGNN